MRWIIRVALVLFFFSLVGSFFSIRRLLKNPEKIYSPLVAQIEERWAVQLSFKDLKASFMPWPVLRMKTIRLDPVTERWIPLTADEAEFSFDFFPLLFGKFRLGGIQIQNAKGAFWGFPLEEVDFKVKNLGSRSAPFDWRAVGSNQKEILRGRGQVSLKNWEKAGWKDLGLKGEVIFDGLTLKDWAPRQSAASFPKTAFSGELKGRIQFEKFKGASEMPAEAKFEIQNFHPGSSAPFAIKGQAQFLWRPEERLLELQEFGAEAPFGDIDGKGMMNAETGEIAEVRISGRKVVLEEAVRYFPMIESFLPLGIGFSGESEFDINLQGTWDYLAIHANWNLTPAVLTYGKVFSKPKDFPGGINCDFILKSGSALSGDFSIRIHQANSKGSFTGLDLKTGEGELTFITNKFELQGWETLLPALASFKPGGSAKILMHWKGNLAQPKRSDQTFNVTLENVSLLTPEGRGIRQASVLMDVSRLNLRLKDGHFEIGGSPFNVQTEIYGLSENPKGSARIVSPRLDPHSLSEDLKVLNPFLERAGVKPWLDRFETEVLPYFPKSGPLEEWVFDLKVSEKVWTLENLSFRSLGGAFRFSGTRDLRSDPPTFSLNAEIDRANLTRYFEGIQPGEKVLDGNLFFNGRFQGKESGFTGQGTFSMANGEWHTLDLFMPLLNIDSFRGLESHRSGSTPFTDLKIDWTYGGKKFETKDFLLFSDDWRLQGEGNLSLAGTLNARFQAYLSPSLTRKVLASWNASEKGEGKQLGPIPLLLLGNFRRPEVKTDERKIGAFTEDVRARRYRRILERPEFS